MNGFKAEMMAKDAKEPSEVSGKTRKNSDIGPTGG
jgi:hypothetical protein